MYKETDIPTQHTTYTRIALLLRTCCCLHRRDVYIVWVMWPQPNDIHSLGYEFWTNKNIENGMNTEKIEATGLRLIATPLQNNFLDAIHQVIYHEKLLHENINEQWAKFLLWMHRSKCRNRIALRRRHFLRVFSSQSNGSSSCSRFSVAVLIKIIIIIRIRTSSSSMSSLQQSSKKRITLQCELLRIGE